MASSLFQTKKLSNQSNIISLIKGNPVQALTGILQKNPQMKNMLDVMVKGKDPKEGQQLITSRHCSSKRQRGSKRRRTMDIRFAYTFTYRSRRRRLLWRQCSVKCNDTG